MNKYFFKKLKNGFGFYQDVEQVFDGLRILKIEGFLTRGKPLNVYHKQWIDSQTEDFMVCSDYNYNKIIYENKDITIDFIVSDKFASKAIDVVLQHDKFIDFITQGDLYINSKYTNKEVHVVCLEEYKPTQMKLHRKENYIMGTINLHKLDAEKNL